MGYYETYCQLCGVSPAIARIRTPHEPPSAASSSDSNTGFVAVDDDDICNASAGCVRNPRAGRFGEGGGDEVFDEHVAGPGCVSGQGYSGYRIGEEEMRGCRSLQCLVLKEEGWEVEEGDEEWEKEGKYFLTGCGDGSPDMAPLEDLQPVRHGVTEAWPFNTMDAGDDAALPFHPACFQIFKKISVEQLGRVDVEGLWSLRTFIDHTDFYNAPRHPAVKLGREQWWWHEVGSEWLAANPISIPGFNLLLASCSQKEQWEGGKTVPYNVYQGVFGFNYKTKTEHFPRSHTTPPPRLANERDHFIRLPQELLSMIISNLSSKDVANLRLVTPAVRQLPFIFFHDLLLKEMPWLWEAQELAVATTNWYKLWCRMKLGWKDLKGLRNRRRIWTDISDIVRSIAEYREAGDIDDL